MIRKNITIILLSIIAGIAILFLIQYGKADENQKSNNSSVSEFTGIFDNDDSVSKNYLRNGDFYSLNSRKSLMVDTSFVDLVAVSLFWYDKVIEDFPNTEHANQALKSKINTLIGWEDGYGDSKRSYGLKNKNVGSYFIKVTKTFDRLEQDYPDDSELEAYAFQIAQAYFYHVVGFRKSNLKEECKKWLIKTIGLSNRQLTFYSHLADLRLKSRYLK